MYHSNKHAIHMIGNIAHNLDLLLLFHQTKPNLKIYDPMVVSIPIYTIITAINLQSLFVM